jgi:hypothetical protein
MFVLKKYWITIIGIAIGAFAGYMYWQEIGCVSGQCPITSKPLNSTIYGSLMGGLLFNMFEKKNSITKK